MMFTEAIDGQVTCYSCYSAEIQGYATPQGTPNPNCLDRETLNATNIITGTGVSCMVCTTYLLYYLSTLYPLDTYTTYTY